MDERKLTILVMVDFSAAFDMLRRDILLAVLMSHGMTAGMLAWFSSYINGREQCVKGPDGSVKCRKTELGTPQGSVLSAFFFILYLGTMSSVLSSETSYEEYADNLQIYRACRIEDIAEAKQSFNGDLRRLDSWVSAHGMCINRNKTKYMVIGNAKLLKKYDQSEKYELLLGSEVIERVASHKNLGIELQETLSWGNQVDKVCKKVFNSIYQLRRVAIDFPDQVRKQLVLSLIFPNLDYAQVAYCDLSGEDVAKLQRAQNAAVRFALRWRIEEHITPAYRQLRWLKIVERKKLAIAVTVFKVLKFRTPDYVFRKFKFMDQVHSVNTRRAALLQIPAHKTNVFARSFVMQGTKIYNDHVELFKFNQNVETFRENFKKELLKVYDV